MYKNRILSIKKHGNLEFRLEFHDKDFVTYQKFKDIGEFEFFIELKRLEGYEIITITDNVVPFKPSSV